MWRLTYRERPLLQGRRALSGGLYGIQMDSRALPVPQLTNATRPLSLSQRQVYAIVGTLWNERSVSRLLQRHVSRST